MSRPSQWNGNPEVCPQRGAQSTTAFDDIPSLTRAVASGDPRAVAEFYETKFDLVCAVAKRAGFDEQRALDIVQDTFIKAIRGMPTITSQPALDSWLRRIAVRTALDHLRAQRRRDAREHNHAESQQKQSDERIALLQKEMAQMKTSTIELLQLRYQAGLTLDAIARRIGSTTGAVDGQLRRATAALGNKLRAEEES